MIPNFLFPETEVKGKEGEGAPIVLENGEGKTLQLTLGITDVIEQESLDVAVWGSADGADWGTKPLVTFPQKFYKGVYTLLLDLGPTPEIHHLKVKYKMNRWGHWPGGPQFKFYVFADLLR